MGILCVGDLNFSFCLLLEHYINMFRPKLQNLNLLLLHLKHSVTIPETKSLLCTCSEHYTLFHTYDTSFINEISWVPLGKHIYSKYKTHWRTHTWKHLLTKLITNQPTTNRLQLSHCENFASMEARRARGRGRGRGRGRQRQREREREREE